MNNFNQHLILSCFISALMHFSVLVSAQTTIVGWDFSSDKYNNYGVCHNSGVIINANGSFVSSISCDNGQELMANGWRRAKKWVSDEFSTVGFKDITVSFWNLNFGGGYIGTWACQYNIGGEWITIVTYSSNSSSSCANWVKLTDESLPAEAANHPAVKLRWGWHSGSTYHNNGGNRLDNVFVKGTRDCDISVTSVETIKASCPNTNNGRITVNASCPGCCAMQYSINNGSSWQNSNVFNNVGTGNHTVKARDKDFTSCVAAYGSNPAVVSSEPDNVPVAVCKNFTVSLDAAGNGSLTGNDMDGGSTDDCEITAKTPSKSSFNCMNVGSVLVTLSVTDGSNSTSTCQAIVTIRDNVGPVALCQDFTAQLDENGNTSITPQQVNDGSSDACGINTLTLDQSDFSCNTGSSLVTLTVTDINGNASNCSATVSIVDQMAPTASCNDLTINLVDRNTHNLTAANINAIALGSSDNCAGLSTAITNGTTAYDCNDIGSDFILTLTVTDASNNSNTCTATVTIADPNSVCNEPPVAICQDITVSVDDNCEASIIANQIDNGSFDPDFDELIYSVDNEGPFGPGTYEVNLTVDDGEYTSSCSATVMVIDDIAPTASCNELTINLVDRNTYNLTAANINAITLGSSDNCAELSTAITNGSTAYDCNDIGSDFILTLTVADASNNSNTCTATVTIADPNSVCNDPPVAICQDITVSVNGNCEASIIANQIDNGSSDPDFDELIYSVDNEGPFGPGTYEVNLTVDDGEYTSSCSATITVIDDTVPTIDCPDDQIFNTDAGSCASTFTVPVPTADDNCEVTVLRHRYRAVDELGNNISGENWSSWSTSATRTLDVGHWKIQWQAKDPSNNQKKCAFFVDIIDGEAPVPVCLHPTMTFNGETSIDISMSEVWNEAASSDNCGDVFFIDQSAIQITCDQLGSTIPITVTVEDASGNTASCTSNVLVDGLPCNWEVDPAGIGCGPAEAGFDANNGFTLSTESCYDPNYYRQNDQHGFIQQSLCGDGEIIARVTSVTGNGWAGISMRESNEPSARMIQLMIDGASMTRREVRMSAGASAYAHQFATQGKIWLKLSRSGNQFSAYHSLDGVNWGAVFVTNIPMSNCINIGLISMNGSSTEGITGTFANVSIIGTTGNNLQASNSPTMNQWSHEPIEQWNTQTIEQWNTQTIEQWSHESIEQWSHKSIKLFPNPATEEVNIQVDQFIGKDIALRLYNQYGQVVLEKQLEDVQYTIERLQLNGLPAGTYLVELHSGADRLTKKLVVAGL